MSGPLSTKQFHVARGGAQGVDSGPLAGAVVAIGNFDGVHRGHRAVIGAALTRARELGRKAAALTFTPHPRLFLRPQDTLFELSDEHNKLRLLERPGSMALSSCGSTRRWPRHPPRISSSRFSRARSGSAARRSASIFISARTAWARRAFWRSRARGWGLLSMSCRRWKTKVGRYHPVRCVRRLRRAGSSRRPSCWARPGSFPARSSMATSAGASWVFRRPI